MIRYKFFHTGLGVLNSKASVQWTVCEFYVQTLNVISHFKDLEN